MNSSAPALDRARLQHARQRKKLLGGTVCDGLREDLAISRDDWVTLLASMDILWTEPEAGDRLDVADGLNGEAKWLLRGEQRWLLVTDPWDETLLARAEKSIGGWPQVATCSGTHWTSGWSTSAAPSGTSVPSRPAEHAAAPTDANDVVEYVGAALAGAVEGGASDVHFECGREGVQVKYRIDGVLQSGPVLASPRRAQAVISRIKVLAQLDITEQRVPQDGRFRYAMDGQRGVDLRVSIMPSVHGEDAVLRLLDRAQLRQREASTSLDTLRFDTDSVSRIRELALLPHGMLLVTGPTGSGKTTTVYGVLSELNSGQEKIITIEDPVEYELPGVLQIPVNERKGLTFARGLRSILRHDPDRILVGEIRDGETAEIAVQSALTGHQVFTTVHANNLFDVTGRFRHFGIDMFGFMAALNGVVVQRLVRSLCTQCQGSRQSSSREGAWLKAQGQDAVDVVPQFNGCPACSHTGYRGRFVIAEVHWVDDRLRDLITSGQPISALRAHVVQSGVRSLHQVAAASIVGGATSFEEVRRVVGLA